jgi:2-methylisocitrate lyase-like PEP mutase family enzyme
VTPHEKAELLTSLHVPGDPLIVTNVWDVASARVVAATPGVRAVATASHSVSAAYGVEDGEGLSVDHAISVARRIASAVELPVSVDFERGYATDLDELAINIGRLAVAGAAGLNIEDTQADGSLFPLDEAVDRILTVREATTVPLAINARSDALVRGGTLTEAIERGNAYLEAGATSVFVLGLGSAADVAAAVAAIEGPVAVIAGPASVPLRQLADLGVARVSFGPGTLGVALAQLARATAELTALGGYPADLGFEY